MKKRITTLLALAVAITSTTFLYADAPEDIVYNMFNEVLKRNPTQQEFDKYMDLVIENGWDNSDLKRVLRKKKAEALDREIYGGHSERHEYDSDRYSGSRHYSDRDYYEKRRWVEYSFEENVGRLPNRREMRDYCDICLHERYNRGQLDRRIRDDYRGQKRHGYNSRNSRYDFDRYTSNEEVEIIIEEIFDEELGREVDDVSMRKYRRLMIDEGWSESRVRNDIGNSPGMLREDLEKVVYRAYEDLLERRPGPKDRDYYVDKMMRLHWSERQLRDAIRNSREYSVDRPKLLIDKAYRNVLLRDADQSAYALTSTIVRKDWNLQDVENHLRKSREYREQTIPKMLKMVYRDLLDREPDAYGIGFYTERAMEGWSLGQIKDHIRSSDEYAKRGTGK